MKTRVRLLVLFLVIVFFAGHASAGDTSEFSVLGFSEDGRYLSFKMSGVADGSGFPYLFLGIYDCYDQKWAEKPFFRVVEIYEQEDYEKGAVLAEEKFGDLIVGMNAKYSIATFQQGLPVMDRAPYAPALTALGLNVDGAELFFRLREIRGTKTYYDMFTPSGYELTMDINGEEIILSSEKEADDAGEMKWGYSIERALMFRNTIVLIISYKSPGFEGPNTRFMPVGYLLEIPGMGDNQ